MTYARRHAVLLAIIDVWMPKTSGLAKLEVQTQLRVVSPDTKVIVLISRETPAIRAAAQEAGKTGMEGGG